MPGSLAMVLERSLMSSWWFSEGEGLFSRMRRKLANFYFSDNWYASSSTQVSNVTYRDLSFDDSDFHYLLLQNRRLASDVADENSFDACYFWGACFLFFACYVYFIFFFTFCH